jgi:HK97 family phage major capsid protein
VTRAAHDPKGPQMTMTTTRSARLADVKARLGDLRDQRKAARADRDSAAQAFSDAPGGTDSAEFRRARQAAERLAQVEAQLAAAQEEESYILSQIAGTDNGFGESFLRNPEQLRSLAQMAESSSPVGRVQLGVGVAREDVLNELGRFSAAAGEGTFGAVGRGATYVGVQAAPRRQLRLLDLIPALPMDSRSIEYSQEVVVTEGAAETVEGSVKPQSQIDYVDAEAVARTVAHWLKMKKQSLADSEMLAAAVRSRLAYGVLKRLENQIVAGDGAGENLRGLLNTSGIASVPFDGSVPLGELPLRGIRDVMLGDAEPTASIVSVQDWVTMLTAKASGSGEYHGPGPFGTGARTLWDLPAIPSRAMPVGSALVGDFTNGCTLFVREGVNVIASDSDQDDFVRNKVTLLGEGRFALAVWSAASFATVDLAA